MHLPWACRWMSYTWLWLLVVIWVSTRTEGAWIGDVVLFKEGYSDLRGRRGSPRAEKGQQSGASGHG